MLNYNMILCICWLEWITGGAVDASDVFHWTIENDVIMNDFDLERFFEGY